MKKKYFLWFSLAMALLPLTCLSVSADPIDVQLQIRYDDPLEDQDNPHKGPVLIPDVSIDDYTLYFDSSCENCVLRLVNEEDEVVYTTIISSSTLVLPSYLSGDYELQIIQGNYCFYGDISL